MSNVLTLKTRWQDGDEKRLIAMQKYLTKIAIPYPPCSTFDEMMAYVGQTWVIEAIVDRWKFGVIATLYGDEYDTVH